ARSRMPRQTASGWTPTNCVSGRRQGRRPVLLLFVFLEPLRSFACRRFLRLVSRRPSDVFRDTVPLAEFLQLGDDPLVVYPAVRRTARAFRLERPDATLARHRPFVLHEVLLHGPRFENNAEGVAVDERGDEV